MDERKKKGKRCNRCTSKSKFAVSSFIASGNPVSVWVQRESNSFIHWTIGIDTVIRLVIRFLSAAILVKTESQSQNSLPEPSVFACLLSNGAKNRRGQESEGNQWGDEQEAITGPGVIIQGKRCRASQSSGRNAWESGHTLGQIQRGVSKHERHRHLCSRCWHQPSIRRLARCCFAWQDLPGLRWRCVWCILVCGWAQWQVRVSFTSSFFWLTQGSWSTKDTGGSPVRAKLACRQQQLHYKLSNNYIYKTHSSVSLLVFPSGKWTVNLKAAHQCVTPTAQVMISALELGVVGR